MLVLFINCLLNANAFCAYRIDSFVLLDRVDLAIHQQFMKRKQSQQNYV